MGSWGKLQFLFFLVSSLIFRFCLVKTETDLIETNNTASSEEFEYNRHTVSSNGGYETFEQYPGDVNFPQSLPGPKSGVCKKRTKDFMYVLAFPEEIQAYQNFTVLLSLQKSNTPVTFHVSIFNDEKLLVPTKSVTIDSSDSAKPLTLEVKEISFPNIPPWMMALNFPLYYSVNTTTRDILHKGVLTRLSLNPNTHKKLMIEINKKTYAPGETVHYRVLLVDSLATQKLGKKSATTEIELQIYLSEDVAFQKVKLSSNATSPQFIHTGSFIASEKFNEIAAFIPKYELVKTLTFGIRKPKKKKLLKIKLKSPTEIFYPETKANIRLALETVAKSLPVDGTCEIHVKSVWKENITVSSENNFSEVEVDLQKELEEIKKTYDNNYRSQPINQLDIETEVKCFHSLTGMEINEDFKLKYFPENYIPDVPYQMYLDSGMIYPELKNNSITPISLKLQIRRSRILPLESKDLNKTLIVSLEFPDKVGDKITYTTEKPILTNTITAEGIVSVYFNIKNITNVIDFVKSVSVKSEYGGIVEQFEPKPKIWNKIPEVEISLVDKNSPINGGDIAKFYLFSPEEVMESEIEFTTVLHSSTRVVSFSKINCTLKSIKREILEVKIPDDITEPEVIHVMVLGTYPLGIIGDGCLGNEASDGLLSTSMPIYVNMKKPSLELKSIYPDQYGTNELLFELKGGPSDIKHVSLTMSKVTERSTDIFEDYFPRRDIFEDTSNLYDFSNTIYGTGSRPMSIITNGAFKSFFSRESKSHGYTNAEFFEFPVSKDNNGTVKVPLKLETQKYFGKYRMLATTVSDFVGGVAYSNEIDVYIQPPKVLMEVDLIPDYLVVGKTGEILVWIQNWSQENITEIVSYEYFTKGKEAYKASNRTTITINPQSYRTIPIVVTPLFVGNSVLKVSLMNGSVFSTEILVTEKEKPMQTSESTDGDYLSFLHY